MPQKRQGVMPWLAATLMLNAIAIGAAFFYIGQTELTQKSILILAAVGLAGGLAQFVLAWRIIDIKILQQLRKLSSDIQAIAHGAERDHIDTNNLSLLDPLPQALNQMVKRLAQTRADLAQGLEGATAKSEETSQRLAAILNDLNEAVLVCNNRHQVVLYNSVAVKMLASSGQVGLGRPIFETIAREPILHVQEMLTHRPEIGHQGTPFLAGTKDGDALLQARMTLIRSTTSDPTGYVITLQDAGPLVKALAGRDTLLRQITESLQNPLMRLKMAADNPTFVAREADNIKNIVDGIAATHHQTLGLGWPMSDVHSSDFFGVLAQRNEGRCKVNITGVPMWLHMDSQSMAVAIEHLLEAILHRYNLSEVDIEAGQNEHGAYMELAWNGATAARPAIDAWMETSLPSLQGMLVRDVLAHHAGTNLTQGHRSGRSWLRLPMKVGLEMVHEPKAALPTRPEFYDLALLDNKFDTGEMGQRPLRSLDFIVFDTETTGLQPSQGDQIVQIGAVRVVNGRILSGESFNRIVHPGMKIPPVSIQFHGITDEMVQDKPPIGVVLPQFRSFAADGVLVAHNAAFDLKFLRMQESVTGVRFDNPVLDTMLLSSFLDGDEAGHSLDAICERFNINITDRHTALGDAIVTAAVLLRQIDMLEARGITTLDQVVSKLDMNMRLHQRAQAL